MLTEDTKKLLAEKYPAYHPAITEEIEIAVYNLTAVIAMLVGDIHLIGRFSYEEDKRESREFLWSYLDTAKTHIKNILHRQDAENRIKES